MKKLFAIGQLYTDPKQTCYYSIPVYKAEDIKNLIDKLEPFLGHDIETCCEDICTCGLDDLLAEFRMDS